MYNFQKKKMSAISIDTIGFKFDAVLLLYWMGSIWSYL